MRAISIKGSIEISRATTSIGSPIVGSTTSAAKVAPPPTPAIPKELITIIPTKGIMNSIVIGSIPTLGATIIASMAG